MSRTADRTALSVESDATMELLAEQYAMANPKEVRGFLCRTAYLVPVLVSASAHIRRVFGRRARRSILRYWADEEEEAEGLTVTVIGHLSPEEALEGLEVLDDEWWLDQDSQVREALIITVRPE